MINNLLEKYHFKFLTSKRYLFYVFFVFLSLVVNAQDPFFIPSNNELRESNIFLDSIMNKTLLSASRANIRKIQNNEPETWRLVLPYKDGANWILELRKANLTVKELVIESGSGRKLSNLNLGTHYQGRVLGHAESLVSISVFETGLTGFVSFPDKGTYQLNPKQINDSSLYIDHVLYPSSSLPNRKSYECATAEGDPYRKEEISSFGSIRADPKCIKVYFEIDYDIFQDKGGTTQSLQFLTGLFNQVSTLYLNDGIQIRLSGVKIWDTPSPYNGTNSEKMLTQFGETRTSINGDIGQLLSYKTSGGIAWVRGVCAPTKFRLSFASIDDSFKSFPTYSWSPFVMAHELGHTLGSSHTHACVWNGNNTAIDGCFSTEGGCSSFGLPAAGGTLMSYCHLRSVGINFSLGFGVQPGNVIRNTIAQASCLTACDITEFQLDASPTSFTYKAGGGKRTLIIKGNAEWSISKNSYWTILSQTSGLGSTEIELLAPVHNGTSIRIDTLFLSGAGKIISIPIQQEKFSISECPTSSLIVNNNVFCENADIKFSAITKNAGDFPLQYVWQNRIDSLNWENISSGSDSTFSIISQLGGDFTYRFQLSATGSNCPIITSDPSTVRVIFQPQVGIETLDSTTVCLGKTVTLKEKLFSPWTSSLLTRQWFKSLNGIEWDTLKGANSSTLTLSGNEPISSFYQLRLSVEGPSACKIAVSKPLKVDILDTVLVNVISNDSLICLGKPLQLVSIAPTIGNIGFDYQWQQKSNLTAEWFNIPNANLSAYNNNFSVGNYTFRLKYKRKLASCPDLISNELKIRVDTIPKVSLLFPTAKLCPGEQVDFNAETKPNISGTYIWQQSKNNISWANIKETSTNTLVYNAPSNGKNYLRVRFIPDNYANCDSIFSNVGFIETDTANLIKLNFSSSQKQFCLGGKGRINLNIKSQINLPDSIDIRYEFRRDTGTWQIISQSKDTFLNYSPTQIGIFKFRASINIPGITCNRIFSQEIEWNVGEKSNISLKKEEINICFGSPFNLTPTVISQGFGLPNFQWQQRNDFSNWEDIELENKLIYSGNDTLIGSVYYRLKYLNIGEGCTFSYTDSVLVRKKGNTVVRIGANALNPCTGSSVLLAANLLQPETGPATLVWQESNDSISWKNIGGNSFNYAFVWSQNTPKYFRFIYKSSVSGCDSSFSNVLKISPQLAIRASINAANLLFCKGDTILREATISGISGSVGLEWQWSRNNVQWFKINGNESTKLRWLPDSTGTYKLRLKVWNNPISCDTIYSEIQEINIFNAPDIKILPTSGIYCQGQSVLLTTQLSVTNGTIPLNWQQSRNGTTWINIPGADSANYRFPAIDSGLYYFRVISGSIGGNCATGTSTVASITVIPTFSVLAAASKSEVCQNDSVSLKATWRNIPLEPFIQWYVSKDRLNYTLIVGGDKSEVSVKSNDPGVLYYRAQLTVPGYSCGIVFSEPIPVAFQGGLAVTINVSQSISCLGSPIVLKSQLVNPGNAPVFYQWESSLNNVNWDVIPGANDNNYTVQAGVISDRYYRVRLINSTLSCPLTISSSQRATITTLPTLVLSTSKLTVCAGEVVRLQGFSVRNYDLPVTWRWFSRTGTGAFNLIVGANDSVYFAPTNLAGKTSYQLRMQIGDAVCASASSIALDITVTPNFTLTLQQDNTEKCVDNLHRLFAVITGANKDSLTYKWQRSVNGIQWEFVDVPSFFQWYAPVTTQGHYYRVGVQNANSSCGISFSNAIRLTGEPMPTVTIQSAIKYACRGDFVPITATISETPFPFLYRWQFSRDNKFWNTIAEAGALTERFNITTTGTYYFRVQILKLGTTCVSYSNVHTIQGIQAGSAILKSNQGDNPVLCPGVNTILEASLSQSSSIGIKYKWQYSPDGIAWTILANRISSKLDINQFSGNKSGYYRAVLQVDSSICPDLNTPAIYVRSAGFDDFSMYVQDTTLCVNGSTLLQATSTGNTEALSYQWQQLEYIGNWLDLNGKTTPSLRVSAPDPGVLTFRLKIKSSGSSCPNFFQGQWL